jgi:hypothetical protein
MLATFGKDALEKSLNDDELRDASDRGYRIVRDGPASVRQFLSEIKQQDVKRSAWPGKNRSRHSTRTGNSTTDSIGIRRFRNLRR